MWRWVNRLVAEARNPLLLGREYVTRKTKMDAKTRVSGHTRRGKPIEYDQTELYYDDLNLYLKGKKVKTLDLNKISMRYLRQNKGRYKPVKDFMGLLPV